MALITAIFRLSFALIALFGAIKLYHSAYRHPLKKGDKYLKSFFGFLLFLFFFQVFLSLPAFLFYNNPSLLFWSYEIAMVFYFSLLFYAVRTALLFLDIGGARRLFMSLSMLGIGAVVISLQLIEHRLPFIKDGFVIWHSVNLAGLLAGLSGIIAGLLWVGIFFKYGQLARLSGLAQIKRLLIILGSLFLGLSCVVFFLSSTIAGFFVTHLLTSIGMLCVLIVMLFPKRENNNNYDSETNIYQ